MENNCFFSTANSGNGFVNFNDVIYRDLEHFYIIKGGPGTGKSSFLKKLNKEALKRNFNTECFLCSSDPKSLDGLIINGRIGIIDGTSPHNADTVFPGIRDNIINLGMFWNDKILRKNKEIISELSNRKSQMYNKLYLFLQSALNIEKAEIKASYEHFNFEKADKKINAFLSGLGKEYVPYSEKIRLTNAICADGDLRLLPFDDDINRNIRLNCYHYFEYLYLEILKKKLCEKKISHIVGYDALNTDKINYIYLTQYNTSITLPKYEHALNKTLNLKLYEKNKFSKKELSELKELEKIKKHILDLSYGFIGEISVIHSDIEELYKDAMNFRKKEKYEKAMINEILSLIDVD